MPVGFGTACAGGLGCHAVLLKCDHSCPRLAETNLVMHPRYKETASTVIGALLACFRTEREACPKMDTLG
jgi:hypothetical protein